MTIATKDGLAVIENGQTCPVVLKPKPIRRPISCVRLRTSGKTQSDRSVKIVCEKLKHALRRAIPRSLSAWQVLTSQIRGQRCQKPTLWVSLKRRSCRQSSILSASSRCTQQDNVSSAVTWVTCFKMAHSMFVISLQLWVTWRCFWYLHERPWVVASAWRHATCVGAGRIVGVKLAKHVRPLQFVRLAMRPNSCVSLARRVTSWFTPRLHRNPTSPTSNFPASRNWTCEVVFRVQHGRGGAGESHCQGLGCALLWTAFEFELLSFSSFAFHLALRTAECLSHLLLVYVCVVTNRTNNHDRIAYMWKKKPSWERVNARSHRDPLNALCSMG